MSPKQRAFDALVPLKSSPELVHDLRWLPLNWSLARVPTSTFLGPRDPQQPQIMRARARPTGLRPRDPRTLSCHLPHLWRVNSAASPHGHPCPTVLESAARAWGLFPTQSLSCKGWLKGPAHLETFSLACGFWGCCQQIPHKLRA